MLTLTIALALLITLVGWKFGRSDSRDYKASWQYARQYAVRYRHQRDDLQKRLTRRVLEVRTLRHRLAVAHHRTVHAPSSLEALRLAATAYHVDYQLLLSIASCESLLNPYAKNRHSTASGLMQFLTSTWAHTPYANESIWSPYANALAGAWLISRGGRSQWIC